jgi:hypothetical protein
MPQNPKAPLAPTQCTAKYCHEGTIYEPMGTKLLEPIPCPTCIRLKAEAQARAEAEPIVGGEILDI